MKNLARIFAFLLLGVAGMVNAEYVIKFSHTDAPTTAKGQAARYFAEQVNLRLAGKVRVEVFPDASLYGDDGVIEALAKGDVDTGIMAAPRISRLIGVSDKLALFDLPFLFDDIKEVHKLVDSPVGEKLLEPLAEAGLKGLAFWDDGMKVFSVRGISPLRKPEDFQDKTIRTQGSDIGKATISALGGIPQELPAEEVYSALANGKLDGQEDVWSDVVSAKIYEVQDWISVSNHAYRGYLVVVGLGFWDGLPEQIKGELTSILLESTKKARDLGVAVREEERKQVNDAGKAIVLGLTSSELEDWRKATADVTAQYAAEIGKDLIAEARAVLERVSLEELALEVSASNESTLEGAETEGSVPEHSDTEEAGVEGSGSEATEAAKPEPEEPDFPETAPGEPAQEASTPAGPRSQEPAPEE